jgi:hypothetical protein
MGNSTKTDSRRAGEPSLNLPEHDPAKTVEEFASALRREFRDDFAQDARAFRYRIIQLVRRALPLRRGRPPDETLNAAWEMRKQGKSVREVLGNLIPNFEELDLYLRYLAEKGLRQALARRDHWEAARKKKRHRNCPSKIAS